MLTKKKNNSKLKIRLLQIQSLPSHQSLPAAESVILQPLHCKGEASITTKNSADTEADGSRLTK